ncbi:AfsR/SARP family transcriptional regulator [Fimbriimonas ginsengisoli]|uniref:Transcriptional activator n=1 Tax=Fimbriimonas ginsengisoli Gsoil 348 TaxID=661478 RepID=A0A068NRP4_FIMGI|nr:tetratricopeptide repeat protein [Fimbriimonas ginsengisoli]AIE86076.1 transcriptional activator [Fimbriimonas ginsengisoli Gsoil 348]
MTENEEGGRLNLRLFGPFSATVDGVPIRKLRTQKGRWLLALLALREGRPIERGWIAATLWPDNDPSAALYSLRRCLTDLRDALGPAAKVIVSPTPSTLQIVAGGIDCDVSDFDAGLRKHSEEGYRSAIAIHTQALIPECSDEWIFAERETRAAGLRDAFHALAELSPGDRLTLYARLLSTDPFDSKAVLGLVSALAAAGAKDEARRTYREYVRRMQHELQLEPTPKVAARIEAILGSVAQDASSPNNAPKFSGEFVGRVVETEAIVRALRHHSVVTLTGPGGVGKTRLASHSAERLAREFPDGVWFVHLAEVRALDGVPAAIANALRAIDPSKSDDDTPLAERLAPRRALIVLDNCEHVTAGVVPFVEGIVAHAPDCRVLTTSQVALGLESELVVPVPLLEVANDVSSEAVHLFRTRARGLSELSDVQLEAIAAICRRLDGLPLAIELAASRTSTLTVPQIEQLLGDRFRLLVGRNRDPRHAAIEAAISWSYELLDPEARRAFRAMSAFRGAFDAELAAAAIGCDLLAAAATIEELVDRSLLTTSSENPPEFRMLESLRAFGIRQLEETEEAAGVWDRLDDAIEAFAQRASLEFSTARHQERLSEFDRRLEDVSAALERCLSNPALGRRELRIAAPLGNYLWYRGRNGQSRRMLTDVLNRTKERADEWMGARANCLHQLGVAAWALNDYDAAESYLRESLALFRRAENPDGIVRALLHLSIVMGHVGRTDESRALVEEAISHESSEAPTPLGLRARMLFALEQVDRMEYDSARAQLLEVLRHSEAAGMAATLNAVRLNLGRLLSLMGEFDLAHECLRQALEHYRREGNQMMLPGAMTFLGYYHLDRGELKQASTSFLNALDLFAETGDRRGNTFVLEGVVRLAGKIGDHERTLRYYGALVRLRCSIHARATLQMRAVRRPWVRKAVRALGWPGAKHYRSGKEDGDPIPELRKWLAQCAME